MEPSTGLADDVRASADARRELRADYDPAVVEAFLERVDREIDYRVDRRIAAARAGSTDWTTLLLALGSVALGLGVPSATHDQFGTAASYVRRCSCGARSWPSTSPTPGHGARRAEPRARTIELRHAPPG